MSDISKPLPTVVSCPVCNELIAVEEANAHVLRCVADKKRKDGGKDPWGFLKHPVKVPSPGAKHKVKPQQSRLRRAAPIAPPASPKRTRVDLPSSSASASPTPLDIDVPVFDSDDPQVTESSSMALMDRLKSQPLAELMRPKSLSEFVGQDNVTGEGSSLLPLLKANTIPSLVLWGPPGCGKTTLARIIAHQCRPGGVRFVSLSATCAGVGEVKELAQKARNERALRHTVTIVFLDEIHRFNKGQQDVLLPHVEDGTLVLIGATTENPSFALNSALLSRCRVVKMEKLQNEDIDALLQRTMQQLDVTVVDSDVIFDGQNDSVYIESDAVQMAVDYCDGDARVALNALQNALQAALFESSASGGVCLVTLSMMESVMQRSHLLYDRNGDQHYDCISALHKSVRGSDKNGAVYWLARMLEAGEDPRYVARRLMRMASEDIGLGDPQALSLAVSAAQSVQLVGRPECDVMLAQTAVYLANAPKSVEVYKAYNKAKDCIAKHKGPQPSVPLHLRNAPTKLMKQMGYGAGYKYNPAFEGPVDQTYMPEELAQLDFFS